MLRDKHTVQQWETMVFSTMLKLWILSCVSQACKASHAMLVGLSWKVLLQWTKCTKCKRKTKHPFCHWGWSRNDRQYCLNEQKDGENGVKEEWEAAKEAGVVFAAGARGFWKKGFWRMPGVCAWAWQQVMVTSKGGKNRSDTVLTGESCTWNNAHLLAHCRHWHCRWESRWQGGGDDGGRCSFVIKMMQIAVRFVSNKPSKCECPHRAFSKPRDDGSWKAVWGRGKIKPFWKMASEDCHWEQKRKKGICQGITVTDQQMWHEAQVSSLSCGDLF